MRLAALVRKEGTMHFTTKSLASTAFLAAFVASSALADAGFTANGQFTTNYALRGISQSAKRPAVQGGVDYDTGLGFTFGTWFSSLDFGDNSNLEWDHYGAYNFKVGDLKCRRNWLSLSLFRRVRPV